MNKDKLKRLRGMRTNAKANGKIVPEMIELEYLAKKIEDDYENIFCPKCDKKMKWKTGPDRKKGKVVSLQHNLDGTVELICVSCNSAHGASNRGDDFWISAPQGFKHCGKCNEVKEHKEFSVCNKSKEGRQSYCKACSYTPVVKACKHCGCKPFVHVQFELELDLRK